MKISLKYLLQCGGAVLFIVSIIGCGTQSPQTEAQKVRELEAEQDSEPNYEKAAKINAELGILYTKRNMLDLAKIKILTSEKLADLPITQTAFGVYYAKMGKDKLAEKAFERALDMSPNDSQTMTYYATFLCENKQYDKAKKFFQKAIKESDNTILGKTYLAYAICQQNEGKAEQAKTSYLKTIEQNPNLSFAYLALSEIYTDEKSYNQANTMLNKYLSLESTNKAALELEIKIAKGLKQPDREATARLMLRSLYQ